MLFNDSKKFELKLDNRRTSQFSRDSDYTPSFSSFFPPYSLALSLFSFRFRNNRGKQPRDARFREITFITARVNGAKLSSRRPATRYADEWCNKYKSRPLSTSGHCALRDSIRYGRAGIGLDIPGVSCIRRNKFHVIQTQKDIEPRRLGNNTRESEKAAFYASGNIIEYNGMRRSTAAALAGWLRTVSLRDG